MKTTSVIALITACLASASVGPALASTVVFSDDFEGSSLNPFWSTLQTTPPTGFITFPSTVQAHSGSQSVQFNTQSTPNEKDVGLLHNFSSLGYGQASVWVYDTGANVSSSNYLTFYLYNQTTGVGAVLNTRDYDLGPGNGGEYGYDLPDGSNHFTTIDRTLAWHQWSISSLPGSLTLAVDGTTVYSGNAGMAFDSVKMEMFAPGFRPNWVSYWDDFSVSFTPLGSSTVPEPSSLLSAALGLAGLAGFAGWRRVRGVRR